MDLIINFILVIMFQFIFIIFMVIITITIINCLKRMVVAFILVKI